MMNRKLSRTATWVIVFLFATAVLYKIQALQSLEKTVERGSIPIAYAQGDYYEHTENVTAAIALALLREGNTRFMKNEALADNITQEKRTSLVVNGQKPFATIVGCSDSRVPLEILFDQGIGDLFEVKDAGNVVDSIAMGSVEYGAEHLHTPIIVVMGHSKCGAVKATVDGGEPEGSIGAIVNKIKPGLRIAQSKLGKSASKDQLYSETETQNILVNVQTVMKSKVIQKLMEEKKVVVLGAKYDLETGKVSFIYSSSVIK